MLVRQRVRARVTDLALADAQTRSKRGTNKSKKCTNKSKKGHKQEQKAQTRANRPKKQSEVIDQHWRSLTHKRHKRHPVNMGPPYPMLSQRMVKVNASVLQTLPGLERLEATLFEGKTMRQLARGYVDDEGNDVSGFFVVADGGAAVIFTEKNNAIKWANNKNQVNIEIAPSLTYIDSGNTQVDLLKLT